MKVPNFIEKFAQERAMLVVGRVLPYIKNAKKLLILVVVLDT